MNILQYITTNSDTIDNNPQGYLDMVHSVLLAEFAKNEENLTACRKNCFTSLANKVYAILAFAKSEAERGNSNYLYKANIISTPKNRAIFVCGLHTPKERYNLACSSMVACSGQGFALDCFPCIAVFPPRYTLSPYTVESVSDSPSKFIQGLLAMLFKFITLGEKRLKITVHARNEQEARNKLICSHAVLFARINTKGGLYA
ncbi:ash family protein [Actinobacillus pleuropneumoniae]|uniref:ash family protein n=1 Tax=Actinobacillus pleuropneumoniae TaxID=715 RepID=UPI003F7B5B28